MRGRGCEGKQRHKADQIRGKRSRRGEAGKAREGSLGMPDEVIVSLRVGNRVPPLVLLDALSASRPRCGAGVRRWLHRMGSWH